ncbi:MAG: DUF5675 family protein [Campylobacteraceae bacterium]
MSRVALLIREKENNKQTLGKLQLFENEAMIFECYTLELPWRDNKPNISCIPTGEYKVKPRISNKYGKHFYLEGTKPRTHILIHAGNFYTQTEGCILLGKTLSHINDDGELDIGQSQSTLNELLKLAPNGFDLTIEDNKNE